MPLSFDNSGGNLGNCFKDYAVYDMRTGFSNCPTAPSFCPFCRSALTSSKVKPSNTVSKDLCDDNLIPVYEGSYSYTCPACGWWCVREMWKLCELEFADYDYLITGVHQRRDVLDWLQLFIEATQFMHQDRVNKGWPFNDVIMQEQLIMEFLERSGLPAQAHFLGIGQDAKGQSNLFIIDNNKAPFLIVLNQALSGWISFEAVEIIIGVLPSAEGLNQEIFVTSSRQINRPGKKPRIKSRTRHFRILNQIHALPLFPESPCQNDWTWEALSQGESLYLNALQIPEIIKSAFL